jgi:tripartite-type tricarboxylate transporter receptor subunit TctC
MLRRAVHFLAFLSFATLAAMPVNAADSAADYPSAPVNYVIPFGSGGESDVVAQLQQPYFKELTGQDLYISRKPGGGGAVVWNEINSMPADGYTIVGINLPHIVLQPMLGAQYKTSDIAAVYIFHYTPHAIAVRHDSPFRNLNDLLNYARTSSKALVFSGSGQGTANELAKIHFDKLAGINTRYQAFKGTGASITALLLETVDASWAYTTAGLSYDDDVRLLAIATEQRHPKLPDVPTFRELGFNLVGGAYRGIAVPKGTPVAIRQRLSDLFAKINQNPKMRRDVENLGFAPVDIPYGEVGKFLDEKSQEYLKLAREAGIVAPVPRPK